MLLEDLGFCPKGEGGPFVQEGHLRRGGKLPLNTDGGGLSSCHPGMRGIFLLIESVRQLRGQAGEAQVPDCNLALACGSGGWLSCHRHRDPREGAPVSPDVVTDTEWTQPDPAARRGVSAVLGGGGARRAADPGVHECGHRQFYPRAVCTDCGGDVEWLTCSGRGTVHTFTVIRQNHAKPFKDELPYVVAIVELEEGPRMMGNVTGIDPDDMQIGMPVEVYFVQADEGVAVPFWRAAPLPNSGRVATSARTILQLPSKCRFAIVRRELSRERLEVSRCFSEKHRAFGSASGTAADRPQGGAAQACSGRVVPMIPQLRFPPSQPSPSS